MEQTIVTNLCWISGSVIIKVMMMMMMMIPIVVVVIIIILLLSSLEFVCPEHLDWSPDSVT